MTQEESLVYTVRQFKSMLMQVANPQSRTIVIFITVLLSATLSTAQSYSSAVDIITVYSQNERFYLKSIPYDNEEPSLRGKTFVYEKANAKPLYIIERGFDLVDKDSNNLVLSNSGEVILYAISWGANENKDGLKSITIYKKGELHKSFTETEINGCDKKKERCSLVYSNYEAVVDRAKSNFGTTNYKKAFKEGVNEKERFLSDFPIFSFDDMVFLTDSKRNVHQFDLKEGRYLRSDPFDKLFEQIKNKGRFTKTELQTFKSPTVLDFPKLKNGKDASHRLADLIGMKRVDSISNDNEQYKIYTFKLEGTISQDGSLEIEDIEFYADLPKERIIEFFKTNKFDSSFVPREFERWYLHDEYFSFRNKSDRLARQQKQTDTLKHDEELKSRMTAESIEGIYIPKNLGECFVELDKLLTEIDKKEMQALPDREGMIQYHHGLGTWLRNNWGLWGGSRLQRYFTDRGVTHPDDMSSIVLNFYHDWLSGKKETWKDWEKKPHKPS